VTTTLLPPNSTVFEQAVETANDIQILLGSEFEKIRGQKYQRPLNPLIAPYLVQEYGLAPIADYFGTVEELIDDGRAWQKIRGTILATEVALAWIGYEAILVEDQNAGRRRWHLYQIDMGKLPTAATEDKLLADAEYLADLSDRARSVFFRGFHGYDVRPMVWGRSRWGNSIWGDSSGIRINGGTVKWSHGRDHAITGTVDPQAYVRLGIDFLNGDQISWNTPLVSWNTPGITWNAVTDADAARSWYLAKQSIYFAIRDAAGDPIGYARCFDVSDVTGTENFDEGARYLKLAAIIPFNSADGAIAASVGVVIGAVPAAGVKAAKRWFAPQQLVFADGEIELISAALSMDMMKTCRERITAVVEI